MHTAAVNLAIWGIGSEVLAQFQTAQIPVLVFKSLPQIEDLYGNVGSRVTGDIDVLVPHVHASEAFAIAVSSGWRLEEQTLFARRQLRDGTKSLVASRPWHFRLTVGGVTSTIDLHSDRMTLVKKPVLDAHVWLRATPRFRDGLEFSVPGPEDRLLFLCWHFLDEALNTPQVPWPKLVDIQQALKQSDRMDLAYLSRRAQATGVTLALYLACGLAERNARETLPFTSKTVLPAAPIRARILTFVLPVLMSPAAYRLRKLVWLFTNDRIGEWLPTWLELFVPTRETVALSQAGAEPSAREYLRYVARMYRRRARDLFRHA